MIKTVVLRIIYASFITAFAEAALPDGRSFECAKRALAVIETVLIIEPIIGLITSLA